MLCVPLGKHVYMRYPVLFRLKMKHGRRRRWLKKNTKNDCEKNFYSVRGQSVHVYYVKVQVGRQVGTNASSTVWHFRCHGRNKINSSGVYIPFELPPFTFEIPLEPFSQQGLRMLKLVFPAKSKAKREGWFLRAKDSTSTALPFAYTFNEEV